MRFAWLALTACGGMIEPNDDVSVADASIDEPHEADAPAPACAIVDAYACKTGPTVVSCWAGGQGAVCFDAKCGDFADASCTNECSSSEYGVSCNLGDGVQGDPPSDECRIAIAIPNGTVFWCCPCE